MDKFTRIFKLHQILDGRRVPIARADLQTRLECSSATLTRLIAEARDYLDAPILFDRERGGYCYDTTLNASYQLPGVWFNASELYALLTVETLLESAEPGLLADTLGPIKTRIKRILENQGVAAEPAERRIRILRQAGRGAGELFQTLAGALMQRKRLAIIYYVRDRDEPTQREISPQRMVHYRDNWYLDAWCHARGGLRSFAVECVRTAAVTNTAAQDLPEAQLDAHFASAYGIFSGQSTATAVLRFTPYRARWVAGEHWHPQQSGRYLEDGRYELSIPYSDPRELIMDILKFGPDVEVVAPPELRAETAQRLRLAAGLYDMEK